MIFMHVLLLLAILGSASAATKKVVVLSTQRSGSSFIIASLDRFGPQFNFSSEIFSGTAFKKEKEMISFLDNWYRGKKSPLNEVAGFKAMYNQLAGPRAEWFKKYIAEHKFTIVHLVREAFILSIASRVESAVKRADGHAHMVANVPANVDLNLTTKVSSHMITEAIQLENIAMAWKAWARAEPRVNYHYYSYEEFVGPKKQHTLERLFEAVIGRPMTDLDRERVEQPKFSVLHEPTCSTRLSNYKDIASKLTPLNIEACNLLDSFAAKTS